MLRCRCILFTNRSELPLQHKIFDFSRRMDLYLWKIGQNVPGLRVLDVSSASNSFQKAFFNAETEDVEFRSAPMRPILQIATRPQRNCVFGVVTFLGNFIVCVALGVAAFVCHVLKGNVFIATFHFLKFCYLGFFWNLFCFSVSMFNTVIGILGNAGITKLYFDVLRGRYSRGFYLNCNLDAIDQTIISEGRMLYRLKRSSRGGSRYSVVAESGHIGEKYYDDLAVPRNATLTEIKSAYLHLKQVVSPVEEPIRYNEINAAYAILSQPSKRSLYDQGGDAAVKTVGSNALFTGFVHPKSPTYRTNVRESIGGNFMRIFFIGDIYFSQFQMLSLDRVDISRIDFETLQFTRCIRLASVLYTKFLSRIEDLGSSVFEIRSRKFVQKYVLSAPLGPQLAFMIGTMYKAVAESQMHPYSMKSRLAPKILLWKSFLQYFTIFQRFYAVNKSPTAPDAAFQYVTAQIEFLRSEIYWCTINYSTMALTGAVSTENRQNITKALMIFGEVLVQSGRDWTQQDSDVQILSLKMETAMRRWQKYREKDFLDIEL